MTCRRSSIPDPDPIADVLAIDLRPAYLEHTGDVPQVLVGTSVAVVLQLLDDHVLGKGEGRLEVRARVKCAGAGEASLVEGAIEPVTR